MYDVDLIINYFLDSLPDHLLKLGVDETKLPEKNEWRKIILDDLKQPFKKRKFYYLLWLIDDKAIGHSHINDIIFGKQAYMHLHLWNSYNRQKGNGTYYVTESLKYYFEKFRLEKIFCQPNSLNNAPNKTLERAGFEFIKTYETIPVG
jgi:RimJ/RimL family protein N-acetyltransferase